MFSKNHIHVYMYPGTTLYQRAEKRYFSKKEPENLHLTHAMSTMYIPYCMYKFKVHSDH